MSIIRMPSFCLILITIYSSAVCAQTTTWTDPQAEDLPKSFQFQGEYATEGWGAQVIALDDQKMQAVLYRGGLPGAGWNGKDKSLFDGAATEQFAALTTAEGERRYLAKGADSFSATKQFPPVGQMSGDGYIRNDTLSLNLGEPGRIELQKKLRQSPTMGAKPSPQAIVLFDGSDTKHWHGGRLDEKTHLLNTDGQDILTKRKFNNYRMHLEFMLPFRPSARGQGRGNSGFYQVDHYEMQILDSFGLEGLDNECGGIYQKAKSNLNMCLPPLVWQTYDVEFSNAIVKDGTKVKSATLTARLNGVLIHDKLEIDGKTGGSRSEPEGTPGPIKLQGHSNPLQFRNVWIEEFDG